VVVLRYDQHVGRCLRVDVPEREGAGGLGNALSRDLARHDLAEKAIHHGGDLSLLLPQQAADIYGGMVANPRRTPRNCTWTT